jgi:hypothetical protein
VTAHAMINFSVSFMWRNIILVRTTTVRSAAFTGVAGTRGE